LNSPPFIVGALGITEPRLIQSVFNRRVHLEGAIDKLAPRRYAWHYLPHDWNPVSELKFHASLRSIGRAQVSYAPARMQSGAT
jgi:hypothetical protein